MDDDKPFDFIDQLRILEGKIRNKEKLEWGDPDVKEYSRVWSQLVSYMPKTEEGFVSFIREIHGDYESWYEGAVERAEQKFKRELEIATRKRDEATENLEQIARVIMPYLPNRKD
ncbi:MAG: hypothetical protein AABW48_06295 [Nanoarchaeota archaeon]